MDTDVCVNIIRSNEGSALRQEYAEKAHHIAVSTVTVAELQCGAQKSSDPQKNSLALTQFLSSLCVRAFDHRAASRYGTVRASLETAGKRIGPLDMLIAAQALADNLVLITNNYKEFGRVKGLSAESWNELDFSACLEQA